MAEGLDDVDVLADMVVDIDFVPLRPHTNALGPVCVLESIISVLI